MLYPDLGSLFTIQWPKSASESELEQIWNFPRTNSQYHMFIGPPNSANESVLTGRLVANMPSASP